MMADKLLNAQDLITAKKHDTFRSEVITGKTGGLSTGANIDYATNAVTGQVQKTLPAMIREYGFGNSGLEFGGGGTLNSPNLLVKYNTDNYLYRYIGTGTFPIAIPAAPDGNWEAFVATSLQVMSGLTEPSDLDQVHTRTFESVSDMVGASGLVVGRIYSTGATKWVCNSASPSSISDFSALTNIYIEDFGATDVLNSSAINQASSYASASGVGIYTSLDLVSLDANTNFNGVDFVGAGTLLQPNGFDMIDAGAFINIRQSDGRGAARLDKPLTPVKCIDAGDRKIIHEKDGVIYVATQGGGGESGLLHDIVTGNVLAPSLPSSSLNGSWEFYRTTLCRALFEAFVWNDDRVETGSWTDHKIADSEINGGDSGVTSTTGLNLTARRSSLVGNSVDMTAKAGRDGKVYVGLYGTGTGPTSQPILIDGVLAKTVNLQNSGVWIVELETTPGDHTVTITHDPSGSILYVIGCNIFTLNQLASIPDGASLTKAAFYQRSPLYVKNVGAHDYAVRDKIDNLWGGSYHGGETQRAAPIWTLDGKPINPTAAGYTAVGRAFSVLQKTTITWSTQSLNVDSVTSFGNSAIQMRVCTDGTVRAHTFHTGMSGTNEAFEALMSNKYIDDVTLTTSPQQIGRVTSVTQMDKLTGRKVTLDFTEQDFYNLPDSGGATVTYAPGAYNKVYFGPVQNSDKSVTDLSWVFTKTFH